MAGRSIYKNKKGKRLPSVTTIINRFKDSGGLLYWANEAGLNGLTLEQARAPAATAGTIAHELVEAFLNKRPEPQFSAPADVVGKGRAAFETFKRWQQINSLEILYTEVELVSERYQFGGRLDAVGVVRALNNGLALADWKSSAGIYADMLYQMAAYKILWEENYPTNLISGGFHLGRFAKENGDFSHHYYPDLSEAEAVFLKMRELYDLTKKVEQRVK